MGVAKRDAREDAKARNTCHKCLQKIKANCQREMWFEKRGRLMEIEMKQRGINSHKKRPRNCIKWYDNMATWVKGMTSKQWPLGTGEEKNNDAPKCELLAEISTEIQSIHSKVRRSNITDNE